MVWFPKLVFLVSDVSLMYACVCVYVHTYVRLCMLSHLVMSNSVMSNPMDCSPPGSSVHGIFHARILEWVAVPFSRGSSQSRDRTHVSHIAGDSLPAEPQGKPKNTGVGNLSILQWIFLTQESNWGLLHWRHLTTELSGKPLRHRGTSKFRS